MKNIKLVLILMVFFGAYGCFTEIEFEGDTTSSMLVINSFVTPDSLVKVHVSKSKFFLKDNSQFDVVDNATVNLWVNNVQLETLSKLGAGYYIATYKPKIGDIIKITAKNAIYSEVNGEVQIMDKANIISFDTIRTLFSQDYMINQIFDNYGNMKMDTIGKYKNEKLEIVINFNDPAKSKDFYRMTAQTRLYFEDGKTIDQGYYLYSDDIVFGSNSQTGIFDEGQNYSMYMEFPDDYFNGKKYALRCYTNFNSMEYFKGKEPKKYDEGGVDTKKVIKTELIINLQSISKSYYLFLKSMNSNNNFVDFFSEPVQIHSNINGGIGILGSYTSSIFTLQIPSNQQFYYGGK